MMKLVDTGVGDCFFDAVGGARVTASQTAELRKSIVAIAAGQGYPKRSPDRAAASAFDAQSAATLNRIMDIAPGQASRAGIWSYLCLMVLPDVVRWRFPESKADRFLPGRRNALGRLWWRAHFFLGLVEGRDCLGDLTEDFFVQMLERTRMARSRPFYKAVVTALYGADLISGKMHRPVVRDISKRAQRAGGVICFDVMTDTEIANAVNRFLLQTLEALGLTNADFGGATEEQHEAECPVSVVRSAQVSKNEDPLMAVLADIGSKLTPGHRRAIEWFASNAFCQTGWPSCKYNGGEERPLATRAKGIYKPDWRRFGANGNYRDYALSVRQTPDSPYSDGEVKPNEGIGWAWEYESEGKEILETGGYIYTNRGLMICREDGVPVGAFRKSARADAGYDQFGLVAVEGIDGAFFSLRGLQAPGLTMKFELPLTTRGGDIPSASGVNWGQRERRNPNQAYLAVPAALGARNVLPGPGQSFLLLAHGEWMNCVRAQQNGKAILSSDDNALLGLALRSLIGVAPGARVEKRHLEAAGRTTVTLKRVSERVFILE